jgi:hypothetical protein
MSTWIIERAILGRLAPDDWRWVQQRVRRTRGRLLHSVSRRGSFQKRPTFWAITFAAAAIFAFQAFAGIKAAPVLSIMFVGLFYAFLQSPLPYYRATRTLRLRSPVLSLLPRVSYRQLAGVYSGQSLGVRFAVLGAFAFFVLATPAGYINKMLGISIFDFTTPIVLSLTGLVLIALPILPFLRLWFDASFKSRIHARRTAPARDGRPLSCLACNHASIVGPLERCTECGISNRLPKNFFANGP